MEARKRSLAAQGTAAAGAVPPATSVVDQLERLAGLRERSVLTHAEFEEQKARILAGS